jgi:hypothetical protein
VFNATFNNITVMSWRSVLLVEGVVVFVITWQLDLQLPVQSVLITTNVVSSNPAYDEFWMF